MFVADAVLGLDAPQRSADGIDLGLFLLRVVGRDVQAVAVRSVYLSARALLSAPHLVDAHAVTLDGAPVGEHVVMIMALAAGREVVTHPHGRSANQICTRFLLQILLGRSSGQCCRAR
jgi:hypothetical protein